MCRRGTGKAEAGVTDQADQMRGGGKKTNKMGRAEPLSSDQADQRDRAEQQESSMQRPTGFTHKTRQSPTKTGAVARYVQVPITNISVHGLNKFNKGHAPGNCQAGVDRAERRGRAEPPMPPNENRNAKWTMCQAEQLRLTQVGQAELRDRAEHWDKPGGWTRQAKLRKLTEHTNLNKLPGAVMLVVRQTGNGE